MSAIRQIEKTNTFNGQGKTSSKPGMEQSYYDQFFESISEKQPDDKTRLSIAQDFTDFSNSDFHFDPLDNFSTLIRNPEENYGSKEIGERETTSPENLEETAFLQDTIPSAMGDGDFFNDLDSFETAAVPNFSEMRQNSLVNNPASMNRGGGNSFSGRLNSTYFSPKLRPSQPPRMGSSFQQRQQRGSISGPSSNHLLGSSFNRMASPSSFNDHDLSGSSFGNSFSDSFLKSPSLQPSHLAAHSPSSMPAAPSGIYLNAKAPLTKEEKLRRRREFHNAVERRRRDLIKERIKELGMLVPQSMLFDEEMTDNKETKANKSVILNKTVEYITRLQKILLSQDDRIAFLEEKITEFSSEGFVKDESSTALQANNPSMGFPQEFDRSSTASQGYPNSTTPTNVINGITNAKGEYDFNPSDMGAHSSNDLWDDFKER